MSDRLFSVGPLKVGLDGVLTWIPGVGDAYGLGASAFLLAQAARAGASQETIVRMAMLLGVDAVVGSLPVAGDIFDVVFRAHARAADVLKDEIDRLHSLALPTPEPARPEEPAQQARSPAPPPAPAPSPARTEPAHTEEDEWEQARRVEALRAEVQARGGSILRPRP